MSVHKEETNSEFHDLKIPGSSSKYHLYFTASGAILKGKFRLRTGLIVLT
jgi:hypothetical protein